LTLSDRLLVTMLVSLIAAMVAVYLLRPMDQPRLRPGHPGNHLRALVGTSLMLVGLTFPLVKRTRPSFLKMRWNSIHMVLGAVAPR
jgi:hypothetical protein